MSNTSGFATAEGPRDASSSCQLWNKPTTKVEEVELECYGRRVCAENSQDASSAASTVNKLDVAEFR